MVKLIAFDVDGTLLDSKKQLLPSTIKAIKLLKEKGIKLALATGRTPITARTKQLMELDFDYFICSNGAIVVDKNDNEIFKSSISKEVLESLNKDCEEYNIGIMYCFIDNNYSYVNHEKVYEMIFETAGINAKLEDNSDKKDRHLKDLPWAACITDLDGNVNIIKEKYTDFEIVEFRKDQYDVFYKGINKAIGLKKICEMLDIDISETMGFGDHNNDLELIRDSGIGVVMGNGEESVKIVSKYITDDNDSDGIYNALKHFKVI